MDTAKPLMHDQFIQASIVQIQSSPLPVILRLSGIIRRLCADLAVADLPGQRGRRFGLRGLGQLIPHASHRMGLEVLRGLLVGLKLRKWRLCGRKAFLHLLYLFAAILS